MSEKRVAVFVLQRNLPHASDAIIELLRGRFQNNAICDFYVIESGSDIENISKYCSFHANWPEAIEKGMHYPRGMNYGLSELHKGGKTYDYYFMLMGDVKFDKENCDIQKLVDLMDEYKHIGILSPHSSQWNGSIPSKVLQLHFLVPHVAWLFRHDFLSKIIDHSEPQYMHYFYDGDNFRGYDADTELTLKGYKLDYCTAVTNAVTMFEDHDLMANNADIIKTERVKQHRKLMYEEGLAWMHKKYGYKNKQFMRAAVKQSMQAFLQKFPDYRKFV